MAPTFQTSRFEVLRELGKGGMGVVYAALDRERNLEVALKVIRELSSESLHAFKQEFRSIADIVHPNLICLHELFAEDDQWFFTMELIEGEHFLQFIRGNAPAAIDTPGSSTAIKPSEQSTETGEFVDEMVLPIAARRALFEDARADGNRRVESVPRLVPRKQLECDVERLRHVLRQVAQGLVAVHGRGKLHRDMKSSNVMVTPEGRAVILDFGLASTIADLNRSRARGMVGTLAYASPEQTVGEQLGPASDWYSVGVMMFEALTGYSPFASDTESLLERKLTTPPPSPDDLIEGVPADLNELCKGLLRIDPRLRPSGKDVLDVLKVNATTYYVGDTPSAVDFIGRERELAMLKSALNTAQQGEVAVALVHGPSGFGKSSLIQKFLDGISPTDTLVLRGRCYEQESVPYKGIDSAIDTLAEHLDVFPDVLAEAPVSGLKALVQVFPVLLQSEGVRERYKQGDEIVDPQMRRRAAFQCLREVVRSLSRRRQLVFCIDDMQWSDAESVQLLSSLLVSPDAPAVLYLSSYRSEYEDRNPWLQQWIQVVAKSGAHATSISIGPLSPEESQTLAISMLGANTAANRISAGRIVSEGEGNPFFIYQLAQSAREQGSRTQALADRITLDSVLRHRVATLPASARDLLEVIAITGKPITKADAYAAAGLQHQDPVVLNILRIANLTRSFTFGGLEMVETYHDRIRESVAQSLPLEQARFRHAAVAIQLEKTGQEDPEALAVQFEGATNRPKASHYYELAANRAASALAFDKAARFYGKALALGDLPEQERNKVRLKLADALANAGRGKAAADEYDALSQLAEAGESLELQRKAGFLYCATGHLDKGLAVYDRIVSRLGLRDPRGRRMLTLNIVCRLIALRIRGLKYTRRDADSLPPGLITRIDTTWSLSAGLALIDIPRSMNFGLINLRLALTAGEPESLLNAILMTCWIPTMTGIGGRPLSARLLAIGEDMAALLNTPKSDAVLEHCKAVLSHGCSEWNEALVHLGNTERIYRNHCTGVSWELATINAVTLYTLFTAGDFTQMGVRSEATIKNAAETGDLYSYTVAETFPAALAALAADNPAKARAYVESGLARWSTRGYDVQNAMASTAVPFVAFYEGKAAETLSDLEKDWVLMSQYGFAQHPAMRPPYLGFWMRAALANAVQPGATASQRKKYLKQAEHKVKLLRKSPGRYAEATYPCAAAELAEARGDKHSALTLFTESERVYRSLDMKGYVAAVHRRRGKLIGGAIGDAMVSEADEQLRNCGAVNPARLAATLVGGWQTDSTEANHQ